MTREDGRCDGKNCDHTFSQGEEIIFYDYDLTSIYCTRGCAMSRMPDPFSYGEFGVVEE
jgi:hypothetical protein